MAEKREKMIDTLFAPTSNANDEDIEFTEEDLANRREVLSVFGHDPFEKENMADRKKMYRDVTVMITPDLATDLPKQRGCLTLVRSYLRADKITEAIQELTKDADTMIENDKKLKTLTDMLGKETDIITKTVKDYGFAERYSLAKSKGVGTLSYIMRESEEVDRDDEKINIYDVETSKSMQLASDISAESFFKQIALNAGDYKDIVTKQKKLIKELTDENKKLKEENRIIYEQITKEELLKELAKKLEGKGLGRREIQDMVLAEIHYDDDEIKEMKKRGKKK